MKFKVINGEPLQFHNQNGDLTGTIQISSSGDMIIRPESGSNNIIIGDATTTSTVEFGTVAAPVTLDLLGGGTITSNGNTLNIGSTGDTVRINNAIFTQSLQITGSLRVSGSAYATYFVGDGSGLTNVTSLSASYASTASYVKLVAGPNITINQVGDSFQITGSAGGGASDFPYTGSAIISGSLEVTGSANLPSITGSLLGTASYALNSVSASFSETASYVNPLQQNVLVTGSLIVSASGTTNDFQVGSNKLFVSSSGRVGIGTITPNSALHVNSTATPSTGESIARFTVSDADGTLAITNNTTGDGLFQPALLSQQPTSSNAVAMAFRTQVGLDTGTNAATLFEVRSGSAATITTRPLFLWRNYTTNYMLMDATGSLGLGTSSPSAKLHVNNTGAGNSFLVEDSTNPDATPFVIDADGKVGIGTTSPREQLGIAGGGMRIEANSEASTIRQTSFHSTLYLASNLYYSGSTQPESNSYYILDSGSNSRGGNLFYIKTNGAGLATPSSGFFFYTAPTSSGANTLATLTENFRITRGTASFSSNIVGIGTTTPNAKLHVNNTGAGNSFLVEDSANPDATPFVIDAAGNVGIGTTTTNAKLDVSGSVIITGSLNVTQNITGSRLLLSASNGTNSGSVLTVYGSGSAQPVFTVQGSQGELFSVTDSLSGSLFSVNDISGLPILEVFSDNTTLMGSYQDPMLITTTKLVTTASGAFTIYSLPTASYDTAFFEYSIRSGSNARAGSIIAIQSASAVNFTETTTIDFGSTSGLEFTVLISGANMLLTGSATTSQWTLKTIIRSI